MIVEEKKIPKDESLNSTYNGTDKWKYSKEVIKLTIQNGGASITDEIPGGGMVRQRIAVQEKQVQTNKLQPINSGFSSATITPSSSEISISPTQSNLTDRNTVTTGKNSHLGGANNYLGRNFQQEVKLEYALVPKVGLAKSKVKSLFSSDSKKNQRNFIKENIRAVSLSMKK